MTTRHAPAEQELGTGAIYQLLVTLHGSQPPIWRRIQLPGSTPLSRLHRVVQVVMGWEDYHQHQFVVGDTSYGPPDPESAFYGFETRSERHARLAQVAPAVGASVVYEYDFGDGWKHTLVLEQILPAPADGGALPASRCLAGQRACPPEDCGGIGGYERLLLVLRTPTDPDYEELRTWVGRGSTLRPSRWRRSTPRSDAYGDAPPTSATAPGAQISAVPHRRSRVEWPRHGARAGETCLDACERGPRAQRAPGRLLGTGDA